jgi:hypothetical protein
MKTDNKKNIKWETQSTESKKRLLGGNKTTTVSNQMDYSGVKSKYGKPVKMGEATTVTKTNKKGDVVKKRKVIAPSSGPKTVVTTNRSGNQKIKTKRK